MPINVAEKIAHCFPVKADLASLELVPDEGDAQADDGTAVAVIRLIVWEVNGETQSIRDIKEQQIHMGPAAIYEDRERVANFFGALGRAFADIAAQGTQALEVLMPHDLLCVDALKLKRAQTPEDFDAAVRAKSRLGQFLASG